MLAVVKDLPQTERIAVMDLPRPEVQPGWVLVKVELASICGSDLHAYDWTPDYQERFAGMLPAVLGHEYTGIVEELGPEVEGGALGDRVVSRTSIPCGQCPTCQTGQEAICDQRRILGVHYAGAMAQYVAVPAPNCHVLPADYPAELAVLSEPISIAYNAVLKAGGLQGREVAIIGPGPLGYLVALLAELGGASRVFVLGLPQDKDRLAIFQDNLARARVATSLEEMQALMSRETKGHKMDVVFEVSGAPVGLDLGLRVARKGGLVVLLGIIADLAQVNTNLAVRGEISITGSAPALERVWRRMLDYLYLLPAQDQARFGKAIGEILPLEKAGEAFERLAAGQGFKTVLRP
ncbi:MAG: alcohol dehydrogenase catalytic domain-containing protein [Desulfarculaceae bacterium]|nr:alcohol dehydrogenase catalytic domain-containing protein [Desulfarculaceae bacterium]MCF8071973.1 alcohol dehydrogenase catalytic domain-containing protein [Desulfarculaceae bacterium]MCF8101490.1 alcohol dehydrogenase catalytic domain-containing protein [Desulfarculaceae bacterium]MCF8115040.1 alcohol dehydrogenase catalytic domain-containing protein [Desulfarculaceae bacterium]